MSGRSHAVEEGPLDPAASLAAGATLGDAWSAVRATGAPIVAVDLGGGAVGAVSALSIRVALQALR
ncbi:MAG: hypothetical protein O2865_15495, partial [Planctomycetota bacterium]|nr:hypothetical protein [Planctomycetota bacterium]